MAKMDFTFELLCQARQEQKGRKYLLPSGENAAMYRNCAFDVAEEFADVVNICKLWLEKIGESSLYLGRDIQEIIRVVEEYGEYSLALAAIGKDEIAVERIVPHQMYIIEGRCS